MAAPDPDEGCDLGHLPAVVRAYLEAYNARDVAALTACLTDDVVFAHVSNHEKGVETTGLADFAALATASAETFLTRKLTVLRALAQRDEVALEIAFWGLVANDPRAGGPVADPIELHGASFLRLRDGRIAQITDII